LQIILNKTALNVSNFITIILIIVLFFAAPIVVTVAPVLATVMWIFAGWYTLSTVVIILGQWFIDSIQEDKS
jgi:hypothetical protein